MPIVAPLCLCLTVQLGVNSQGPLNFMYPVTANVPLGRTHVPAGTGRILDMTCTFTHWR